MEMNQTGKMALNGKIIVYSVVGCPHCLAAKATLKKLNLPYVDIRFDIFPHIRNEVSEKSGMKTVPQIYFNDRLIGGNDSLQKLVADEDRLSDHIDYVKNNPMPKNGPLIPDPSTAKNQTDLLASLSEPDEHFALVDDMYKSDVIKTEEGGFFSSKKSYFTGHSFVEWVMEKMGVEEERALDMGQALLDREFAKPAKAKQRFANDQSTFIMVEHNNSPALNGGPSGDGSSKLSANEISELMRKLILELYSVYLSDDGKKVDYAGMKTAGGYFAYKRLARQLISVDVQECSREEKLAFFINIYNALVIHGNIENGPPTGLVSRYKFFNNTRYTIGGQLFSLQDIENGVLRANRKGVGQLCLPFGKDDPRIQVSLERHEPLVHFALVCGAKSCPPIKTFSATNIYEELSLAAKSFLENDDAMTLDVKNKTVELSSIFKWYSIDFGQTKEEVLNYLLSIMGPGDKQTVLKEILDQKNYKVKYLKYDWSINSK